MLQPQRIQGIDNTITTAWVDQFSVADRPVAEDLLDIIRFVNADELSLGLKNLILANVPQDEGAALFVEQHPKIYDGQPVPFYKVPRRKKNRRSEGAAPPPVRTERHFKHETGSEGLIATILTGLSRAEATRFTLHPTMREWRESRPKHFLIVSDFIGSGNRVLKMLEAAWRVPTLRSWWSNKTIRFTICAYSGTEEGIQAIEAHPSKPTVRLVMGCPRIQDQPAESRKRLIDLCKRYCKVRPTGDFTALGYGDSGGLLAFDHGAPNNMPLILHRSWAGWHTLFKQRSTALIMPVVGPGDAREELATALSRLRQQKLAASDAVLDGPVETQQLTLILAALRGRPRTISAVSARTGLPVDLVQTVMLRAHSSKLIDDVGRLTGAAYREFEYLRRPRRIRREPPLVNRDGLYYTPQSLRPSMLRRPR